MARANPNLATPGPFRQYVGECTPVHGLSEILDRNAPTLDNAGTPELHQFHDRDAGVRNDAQLAGKAGDFIAKPASLFSGSLRLLVQDHYSKCIDTAVPYSYSFEITHGLMLTDDGAPWIIEIHRTEGVRAIRLQAGPLNKRSTAPTDEGAFSFDHVIAQLPPHSDQRWRLLADAPTLFANLAGDTWYGEGWAFNLQGDAAAIVLRDARDSGGRSYWYTRVYRIAIAQSDQVNNLPGNVTQTIRVPSAATLSTGEEGFLWQPQRATRTRLKRPTGTGTGALVISEDALHAGITTPPAPSFTAPVYCWFKGAALQTVRWHFDEGATTTTTTPAPAAGETGGYGTRTITTRRACYSSPGREAVNSTNTTGDLFEVRKEQTLAGWTRTSGFFGGHRTGSGGLATMYSGVYELVREARAGAVDALGYWDVLVLPMLDREAAYHARESRSVMKDDGTIVDHLGWFSGDQRATGVEGVYEEHIGGGGTVGMLGLFGQHPAGAPVGVTPHEAFPPTFVAKPGNFQSTGLQAVRFYGGDAQTAAGAALAAVAQPVTTVSGVLNETGTIASGDRVVVFTTHQIFADGSEFDTPNTPIVFASQIIDVLAGPATVPAATPDRADAARDDVSVLMDAALSGSVIGVTLLIDDALHDAWLRKADAGSGQTWHVTQDANDGNRTLYSTAPQPEGGALGTVLAGSATYTPGAIDSPILAWIGRP